MKIIITNLKGQINYNILSSVDGQLSDGIWEDSRAMEKYWKYTKFVLNENNEVVLYIGSCAGGYGEGGFRDKDEKWIKRWFANKIKQVVKIECEDHNEEFKFNDKNENKLRYMNDYCYDYKSKEHANHIPTVKDCYNAYKTLIK